MPNACPLAREAVILEIEVRQKVFKSHRIIFTVDKRIVRIHRVVHVAKANIQSLEQLFPQDTP